MGIFARVASISWTRKSPCAVVSILVKTPKPFLIGRLMPPGSVDDIRKEICKSSSNSGEVSLIQRDLLRQCYLSEQLAETFEFCESKLEYIDSDTA